MQISNRNGHLLKVKFILYLIVIPIFIQACDPARVLVVKAADKPNVSVTVYGNKMILPGREGNGKEKIVIKIPTTGIQANRDTIFYYGLGGWPRGSKHMEDFSKNIDSIIIINSNNKIALNNQTDINTYLTKHTHGFANRILTIEAK